MKVVEVCGDWLAGWVEFLGFLTLGYDFQTWGFRFELTFTWHSRGWHGLDMELWVLCFYAGVSPGWMEEWPDDD